MCLSAGLFDADLSVRPDFRQRPAGVLGLQGLLGIAAGAVLAPLRAACTGLDEVRVADDAVEGARLADLDAEFRLLYLAA